jgi:hypothetical protein
MRSWRVSDILHLTYSYQSLTVETAAGRIKLRSACHGDLIAPPTKTTTFGSRSSRSAAPTVWNSLRYHLRQSDISRGQFASGLKTWLFSCAYTSKALLRVSIEAASYKTTDCLIDTKIWIFMKESRSLTTIPY